MPECHCAVRPQACCVLDNMVLGSNILDLDQRKLAGKLLVKSGRNGRIRRHSRTPLSVGVYPKGRQRGMVRSVYKSWRRRSVALVRHSWLLSLAILRTNIHIMRMSGLNVGIIDVTRLTHSRYCRPCRLRLYGLFSRWLRIIVSTSFVRFSFSPLSRPR